MSKIIPFLITHLLFIKPGSGPNVYQLVFQLKYKGSSGTARSREWTLNDFGTDYEDKWTNIVLTHNSSSVANEVKLYINGVSSSWTSTPSGYPISPTSEAFSLVDPEVAFIMNETTTGNRHFRGAMSHFAWWNEQISDSAVETLYNCGIAPTSKADTFLPDPSSLALLYTFGDQGGDGDDHRDRITNIAGDGTQNHLSVYETNSGNFSFITSSVPLTASQAEFAITASQNGSAYNINFVSSKCSFILNSDDVSGGIDDDPGDVRRALDVVNANVTSSATRTIISSRFSAPGGIETSPAYLDVYSREYSVYNSLNYRNLTVRSSGSGESSTIRISSNAGRREGQRTLLSRHCGKFGVDSQFGVVIASGYEAEASTNKMHRNVGRRPTDASTIPAPVFNEDHNNAHMSSLLPRSDFQYSWVTSSLGSNYSYKSGKQRIYGYADADGMLSSSVAIGGESGHVAAINFPTASEIFGV